MTSELQSRRATLYIIRHGHTAANAHRYAGWDDEPLDASGREQAKQFVAVFATRSLDAIYASPLSRARDTAFPLAVAKRLPVEVCDDLIEMNFGVLSRQPKSSSTVRIRKSHLRDPIPSGESLEDVRARAGRFLAQIRPRLMAGQSIALFSHFWTCRMLLGSLLGGPLETLFERLDYKPATGSVLQVDLESHPASDLHVMDRRLIEQALSIHGSE